MYMSWRFPVYTLGRKEEEDWGRTPSSSLEKNAHYNFQIQTLAVTFNRLSIWYLPSFYICSWQTINCNKMDIPTWFKILNRVSMKATTISVRNLILAEVRSRSFISKISQIIIKLYLLLIQYSTAMHWLVSCSCALSWFMCHCVSLVSKCTHTNPTTEVTIFHWL